VASAAAWLERAARGGDAGTLCEGAARAALRHFLRRGGARRLRVVAGERPVSATAVAPEVWRTLGPLHFTAVSRAFLAGAPEAVPRSAWDAVLFDAVLAEAPARGGRAAQSPLTALREGTAGARAGVALPAPRAAWTLVLRYLARDLGGGAAEAVAAVSAAGDAEAAMDAAEGAGVRIAALVAAAEAGLVGLQATAVAASYLGALGEACATGWAARVEALAGAAGGTARTRETRAGRLAAALAPFGALSALRGRVLAKSPMARDEEEKLLIADWSAEVGPRVEALEAARRLLGRMVG
jgi:hypothetical protein